MEYPLNENHHRDYENAGNKIKLHLKFIALFENNYLQIKCKQFNVMYCINVMKFLCD